MGKLPYFPCYARDVLSSSKIALMSGDAFKAYWILLCASWLEDERATLPSNEANLEALARVDASTWLRIKDEVLACFDTAGNGRLFSPRLLEVSLLQEKRREAGSKGGSKTQAKPQATFKQNLKHQSQSSESESEAETKIDSPYLAIAKQFHEHQRVNFPDKSALKNGGMALDADGARELEKFERINGWTYEKIIDVLKRVLDDPEWRKNIISLRPIRKRMPNGSMKLENADTYAKAKPIPFNDPRMVKKVKEATNTGRAISR